MAASTILQGWEHYVSWYCKPNLKSPFPFYIVLQSVNLFQLSQKFSVEIPAAWIWDHLSKTLLRENKISMLLLEKKKKVQYLTWWHCRKRPVYGYSTNSFPQKSIYGKSQTAMILYIIVAGFIISFLLEDRLKVCNIIALCHFRRICVSSTVQRRRNQTGCCLWGAKALGHLRSL